MYVTGDTIWEEGWSCHLVWDEAALKVGYPTLKVAYSDNLRAIYGGDYTQVPCGAGQHDVALGKGLLLPPSTPAATTPTTPQAEATVTEAKPASSKASARGETYEQALARAQVGSAGSSPWLWVLLAGGGIAAYFLLRKRGAA